MVKRLSDFGLTADIAYGSAVFSVLLSILVWSFYRGDDRAGAERFGIFVGLWAPTLAILGRALDEQEHRMIS